MTDPSRLPSESDRETEDGLRLVLIIAAGVVLLAMVWGSFVTIQTVVDARSKERIAHERTVQNCLWQHRTPAECGALQ